MRSSMRILLVEDDPRDAELAMKALAAAHPPAEVVHLRDGADALDFLYARGAYAGRGPQRPAVMLLDLKMPRIDGLEVLRQVKSDPDLKTMPVVMLTSSREDQDVLETYALGANAYVVKPVGYQNFLSAIKSVSAFWAGLNEPPPPSEPAFWAAKPG